MTASARGALPGLGQGEEPCLAAGSSTAAASWESLASGPGASIAGANASAQLSSTVAPATTAIVRDVVAAGACPSTVFPPRPPATAEQVASAVASDVVQPLYVGTPAPMGLADYGLSATGAGALVGSVLDTTSVLGTLEANATGLEQLDLYNEGLGPDAFSVQLNAVLTGVTLFGGNFSTGIDGAKLPFDFWTQNVLEYYPSARVAVFATNIWNLSGSELFGPAIYAHGPHGELYDNKVYVASVSYANISYPFNLSLYLNSSLVDGRDAVQFTATLTGPGESVNAPYDYVVFNSTTSGTPSLRAPAEFSANGTAYNPAGLTNDFELTVGGPGDGSQADLVAADADLGLAYWSPSADGGAGGYLSVPAAFNYGGDTGETSSGATVTWSDLSGGPGGLSPFGLMRTGPSFLEGLWNASGPEGSYPVTIDGSPSNAFEVVTPVVTTPWTDLSTSLLVHPSLRADYMEAYDPALSAVVLFGGYNLASLAGLNDTWEFVSGHWTNVSGPVAPPYREGGGLVYDAADGYLVLFGGESGPNNLPFYGDTWIFDSTGWHALHPARAPSPRADFAMAYDTAGSEVVLYGGGIQTSGGLWALYQDTWTFHGGDWTNITSTAGAAPPARVRAAFAYDAVADAVLLVGGASTGSLEFPDEGPVCPFDFPDEWAFSAGRWSRLSPGGTVPPAGTGSLWFDTATGKVYYYESSENLTASGGGCDLLAGDVWSYSGGVWQLLLSGSAPGSPMPRFGTTVVDDLADHVELLFGGQQGFDGLFLADTWAFNPNISVAPDQPYVVPEPSIGPTITTDTFWLAPGNYSLETELSGYAPVVTALEVTGSLEVSPTLAPDPSLGIYTPLWAWSDAQLPAIATSGSGTPSDPYVLDNAQPGPIGPTFGLYNDYGDLLYPGIFLLDTNVPVEVLNPPPFTFETNDWQLPGPNLRPLNAPMFWFWNVSDASLVGGRGIGDTETLLSGLAPFAVVFYDSSDNLVAANNFTAPYGAVLFASGPPFGPFTGPGGNNTVWGNWFLRTPFGQGALSLLEAESNDLIYDNYFDTITTACQPGDPALPNYCWPIYSFTVESLSNRWNISEQPASVVHYAPGFPTFPLNGSVDQTGYQGGNYWDNYGRPPDPLGVLPYDNEVTIQSITFVYIDPGGDYVPLYDSTLYNVTFDTSGLPSGASWGVQIDFLQATVEAFSTTADQYVIELQNGTFDYQATPPSGLGISPQFGYFQVAGANVTVPLTVVDWFFVDFSQTGLPVGKSWYVNITGGPSLSGSGSGLVTTLVNGSYVYAVQTQDKAYSAFGGRFTVQGGPVSESVVFVYHGYTVTFAETGLPPKLLARDGWAVDLNGTLQRSYGTSISLPGWANGTYPGLVLGPAGYRLVGTTSGAGTNNLWTVSGATEFPLTFQKGATFTLSFGEKGLQKSPPQPWCVEVEGASACTTASSLKYQNLTPGVYSYAVTSPLSGQNLTQKVSTTTTYGPNGTIDLLGNAKVSLTFAYRYAVTFTETGLPGGSWSVTLGGVTRWNESGDPIRFDRSNGTYHYAIGVESGYTSVGAPKSAKVDGASLSVLVTFTPKKAHGAEPFGPVLQDSHARRAERSGSS